MRCFFILPKFNNDESYCVSTCWGRFRLDRGAYEDYLSGKLWITWVPGRRNQQTAMAKLVDSLPLDVSDDAIRLRDMASRKGLYAILQATFPGKQAAVPYKKRMSGRPIDELMLTVLPFPVESSFERLMFIAKYLQDESASIDDLSDLLWVDRRTIENDLARLRGNQDPIRICGRPFIINETTRSRGKLHCASTAHPIFLTENLTQVIAMLKGLHFMAEDPMYREYAEATVAEVWGQLSTYAQKRIRFVLAELFSEDVGWIEALKTAGSSFVTERECSNGCSILLDCMPL